MRGPLFQSHEVDQAARQVACARPVPVAAGHPPIMHFLPFAVSSQWKQIHLRRHLLHLRQLLHNHPNLSSGKIHLRAESGQAGSHA